MKNLLAKAASKTTVVKFMDTEEVEVRKLTVAQVMEFQKKLDILKDKDSDPETGLTVQRDLIRMTVVGAEALSDDELNQFPLDDINKLFQSILVIAGVSKGAEGNA